MHILGQLSYNRDYLPSLWIEAELLSDLLKVGVDIPMTWKDDQHGKALRKLKRLLTTAPFLQLPDPNKSFRIDVDACNQNGRGKGAILLQQSRTWIPPPGSDLNNVEIPWTQVAYWSKKLTPHERESMGTTEVEAAAMHDAILHWSPYLQNGVKFEVVVDH
jgi:hypothetical protein